MKIYVNRKAGTLLSEVVVIADGRTRYDSFFTVEKGEVVATQFERNGSVPDIKPFCILQEPDLRELIKAFVDYAREDGMKMPDESHTKGKLEATENHLKDMRTLLKLK